jgi:ribokinase
MTRRSVVVVGSANVDQVLSVDRIPAPGETVLSHGLSTARGGKGQNQAVAASRAGARTTFIGAIGHDAFGDETLAGLVSDDIDVSFVRRVDAPTGTALIAVDTAGENIIIVEPGANSRLVELSPAEVTAIRDADVLLVQLEIPMDTVVAASAAAQANGTTVILNAAPMALLPDALIAALDILVVNETEASLLAAQRAVEDLTELVPIVIVTLGVGGAVAHQRGKDDVRVPAPRVVAVDATGAGDTVCGAFAAALAEGLELTYALEFAVTAASLSVEHFGAVPSIPSREAIDSRIAAERIT